MKKLHHISSIIALTFVFFAPAGCQLQEIEATGEACPPYLTDGGYVLTGIVACYKDHFESECLDSDGNCIQSPKCASCRSDVADCIRYQKDFDLLVENTQSSEKLYISAVNGNPDLSAYDSQFVGGHLNVCPIVANRCIWHASGQTISDFGCIYCKDDICGAECVNLQSSHYNCGTCGNQCQSTEHCDGGKCVPNVKCEADEHIKYQGGAMVCAPDTVAECGNAQINCEDTAGWRDGSCDGGRCAPSACNAGYHIFGASCEPDSVDNCGPERLPCAPGQVCNGGECTNKCQPPYNTCADAYGNPECAILSDSAKHCGSCQITCSPSDIPHSAQTACKDAACRAIACENGYHLYNGSCHENDTDNCGAHGISCSALMPGWKSGACDNSVCIPDACNDLYHLDKTSGAAQCVRDSNTCCGAGCTLCAGASICSGGTCKTECNAAETVCADASGDLYCANLQTSDENCGSCGNICPIPDNAINAYCAKRTCAFDCASGYHEYNNSCEKDDIANCGSHGNKCSAVSYGILGCTAGTCSISCLFGYHEYNNDCEKDDIANCGSHGNKCSAVSNGEAECKNKTCSLSCNSGYHEYNGACEKDDIANCGSHGNKCSGVLNGAVKCADGTCSLSCNSGYHEYNGICEANDNTNCGSHGKTCDASLFNKAANAECSQEGKCEITECLEPLKPSASKIVCGKPFCGSDYPHLCPDGETCCSISRGCAIDAYTDSCQPAIIPDPAA